MLPAYRLLADADVILEELSMLYYEARHTRRMASGRAARLVYLLSKASELVNHKAQLRELAQIREQLQRLQQQPHAPLLPAFDMEQPVSNGEDTPS